MGHSPLDPVVENDGGRDLWARLPPPLTGIWIIVAAVSATSIATLLGLGITHWLSEQSIPLVYIVAVVTSAIAFGTLTGVTIGLLSFLAYNFFFIIPVFTFTIADPRDLFALFVFFAVALLSGSLAGRMREVADAAGRRALVLQSLNTFAATLSGSRDETAILRALATQASATLAADTIVLTIKNTNISVLCRSGDFEMNSADWQAARRVFRTGEASYPAVAGWNGSRLELHAVPVATATTAVLGILIPTSQWPMSKADWRRTLHTLLQHTAIALQRTEHEAAAARARDEAERERLRSALLSSLSHDLRTPLTAIVGAATSLKDLGPTMSQDVREDLLTTIQEEAERLSRFVTNLLHMTRLEAGIDLGTDWIDLADVARSAVARARQLRPAPAINLTVPAAVPTIRGDATLLENVVFNLLHNSVKFSPGAATIDVSIKINREHLVLRVTDTGHGIAAASLPKLFEPFFRETGSVGSNSGTGLGLAIAKRIVEGMGGSIHIESPVIGDKGTGVCVTFPRPESQIDVQAPDETSA